MHTWIKHHRAKLAAGLLIVFLFLWGGIDLCHAWNAATNDYQEIITLLQQRYEVSQKEKTRAHQKTKIDVNFKSGMETFKKAIDKILKEASTDHDGFSPFPPQLKNEIPKIIRYTLLSSRRPNKTIDLFCDLLRRLDSRNPTDPAMSAQIRNFFEDLILETRDLPQTSKWQLCYLKTLIDKKDFPAVAHQQLMALKPSLAIICKKYNPRFDEATEVLPPPWFNEHLNDIREKLQCAIKTKYAPTRMTQAPDSIADIAPLIQISTGNVKNQYDNLTALDATSMLGDYAAVEFSSNDKMDIAALERFLMYEIRPIASRVHTGGLNTVDYWIYRCRANLKNFDLAYQQLAALQNKLDGNDLFSAQVYSDMEKTDKLRRRDLFFLKIKSFNFLKWLTWYRFRSIVEISLLYLFLIYFFTYLNKKVCRNVDKKIKTGKTSEDEPHAPYIVHREELKQAIHNFIKSLPTTHDIPPKEDNSNIIRQINKYPPYPVFIIHKIKSVIKMDSYWISFLIGLAYTILLFIFKEAPEAYITYHGMETQELTLVFYFFMMALVMALLESIRRMSEKTIKASPYVFSMIGEHAKADEERSELTERIVLQFKCRWPYLLGFTLFAIAILLGPQKSLFHHLCLSGFYLLIILLCLLFSCLLCMIFQSIITTNMICKLRRMELNPMSPIKTMGLQKWISVIGSYAAMGSIVITFAAAIPVFLGLIKNELTPRAYFWLGIFIPTLLFYWTYPYIRLSGIVKDLKQRRMNFLKKRLHDLYDTWEIQERKFHTGHVCDAERKKQQKEIQNQMDNINRHYSIFKEIDKSPDSFFDVTSALEMLRVMGAPSLFALIYYLVTLYV